MNPILYTEETTSPEYWEIRCNGHKATLYRVFGPCIEDRIECGVVTYRHPVDGGPGWSARILADESSSYTVLGLGDRGDAI